MQNLRTDICGRRLRVLVTALSYWVVAASVEAEQQDPAALGTQAYKAADYRTAVEYFKHAADPHASPTLIYNMAVSYFRLREFDQAQPLFYQLTELPQWRALAFYNLALIAEALGDEAQAKQFLQLCLQSTDHAKLTALAVKKQQQLTADEHKSLIAAGAEAKAGPELPATQGQGAERRWAGLVNLSWGRDSNAANLAQDVLRSRSQGSDRYTQLLAYGQKYYAGSPLAGSKAFALASIRHFDQFTSLSSQTVGGGVAWERPLGTLASDSGAQLLYLAMDNEPIATQLQLHWRARHSFDQHRLSAAYYPSYFFASEDFAHIDGWRHRMDFDWQYVRRKFEIKVRYRHEINDREDKQVGERFASYSPTSNTLSGHVSWPVAQNLTLTGNVHYVRAEFSGTNNLRTLGGADQQQSRRYSHWQYGVGADYTLAKKWVVSADIGSYSREDNFDVYKYDGSTLTATLRYRF